MLVTTVMTALSVTLLVVLSLQIIKLEKEVEKFGLDNILVIEAIPSGDVGQNLKQNRFQHLEEWGELVIIEKFSEVAYGGGKRVNVMAYGERALPALEPYLEKGHNYFLLSTSFPQGALLDFEIDGQYVKAITLTPDDKLSQVLPGNLLFVPFSAFRHLTERGFSRISYLQKSPDAPSLEAIAEAIDHTVATDRKGKVEVKSALSITSKLASLKQQLNKASIGLSLALGGALALIYGTLSLLEFRQSMYISALLNSFGASKFILLMRTVIENLVIVNATAFALIYGMERYHDKIIDLIKMRVSTTPEHLHSIYWGQETVLILIFVNLGVLISCIPVMMAMRKQVGRVLS